MEPLDFYAKIQPLIQNEARKIATDVYNDLGTRFSVAKVPAHTHTGVDTNRVNEKDLILGNKYTTGLNITGTDVGTLGGIYNPSRIIFSGFAANNADGSPATKRAIINGEILFGQCFTFNDLTPPFSVATSGPGKPFMQFCNSMYTNTASLSNTRVSSTEGSGDEATALFVYSTDETGAIFAAVQATKFDNLAGVLTIQYQMGTNVKLQGAFVIS